ncbi:MAG: efflux RND transporter periplasmic adaptor subunit [Ginsengibacter sp.]
MKNWKLIAGIFVLFTIQSCASKTEKISAKNTRAPSAAPLPVEAFIVTPTVLNANVLVAGTLRPYEQTEIHPEVAGRVVSLSINEGAFVKKGTLLVKLFDEDLQAGLNKLNVQLQIAEKTQQRQEELMKIGGISQQDYDLSILNVSTIKADMQILRAAINKTSIRAPYDGTLGFKNISMGAYITPQTIITTISQVNKLKLEFSVPEKYTNKVKVGNYVSFTTETSTKKYSGRILAMESAITQENRSLKIQALVEQLDNKITAGGFANVDFNLGENSNALMVPTQAIIPQARDKKVIIYRNGTADFATVTTGIRDSSRVEILSGILAGDTILTTGLLSIKPDSKITISSYKK